MTPQGILLLGATGFVGRCLIKRLSCLFPEVYVVSRNAKVLPVIPNVYCNEASLDNVELLKEILPRCRAVFHLASDTTPGSSRLKPCYEATANLLPSLHLLECLQEYNHLSLIYVSSGGTIYGDTHEEYAGENSALSPLSYYGAGKAAFEKFILAYCRQTRNSAIILRPSNFYGPGQPYRQGFGVVPTIFHHVLNGKPMQIWGDGEAVRDFLYIEDFVDFCLQILEDFSIGDGAKVYNIGSGLGTSLNELCFLVEKIVGKRIIRNYRPARSLDVNRIVLDCSRIKRDYQWSARTDLRTGLATTWEWFRTHQTEI